MAQYVIIGLGNFGAALSIKLTSMGHEVIGVDVRHDKVELYKDLITHAICLDVTDESALRALPIMDADAVIVAIGEDFGASVLCTALLKQMGARKIIGRVISPVQRTVIEAIGVDTLVTPEEDSADRLARSLDLKGVTSSYQLGEGYAIIEANVPTRYVGKTVQEVDFRGRYSLNIVTIKKRTEERGAFGIRRKTTLMGVVSPYYKLEKDDVIVLFGRTSDLETILK